MKTVSSMISSMSDTLKKMLILQEHDCKIARSLKELNDIPIRKKKIEELLSNSQEELINARETSKAKEASIHQLEVEIQSYGEQIKKLREQQFQIKSNEEYKALNHEIAHIKEKIKELENREILILEEAEKKQADVVKSKSNLLKIEKEKELEFQQLEKRKSNLESEIQRLNEERKELAAGIDKTLMSNYDFIRSKKKDVALVPIEHGACVGCHMNLPLQVIHDVKKGKSFISCIYCGRLLYDPGK